MAWPNLELIYNDGTKRFINGDNLVSGWAEAPSTALVRINTNPPYEGAPGGFELVLSGALDYWLVQLSENQVALGMHLAGDPGGAGASETWGQSVYDQRFGIDRIDQDLPGVPQSATIKVP